MRTRTEWLDIIRRDYKHLTAEAHELLADHILATHPDHQQPVASASPEVELESSVITPDYSLWLKRIFWAIIALILATLFAPHVHAQGTSQIDVITFKDNTGALIKSYAAPFTIKCNSNVNCVPTGSTMAINSTASAGSSTFQVNGVSTSSQTLLNWQNSTCISVANPSVGNVTFTLSCQLPITLASVAHKFLTSYTSTTGLFTQAQPACGDLSDSGSLCSSSANLAQTIASASHKWLASYSATTGLFANSQPACADLSDSSGGCSMSATAGGDLSGTLPSPTVAGLKGSALPALSSGYLHWNGTSFVFDTPGGAGTVTHTGNLTALALVIGNGVADEKVDTGCSTDGAGALTCATFNTAGTGADTYTPIADVTTANSLWLSSTTANRFKAYLNSTSQTFAFLSDLAFGAGLTNLSGDCTTSGSSVIGCTKTGGTAFTALATTTPATGVATFLATPSSANFFAAITDETGSGKAVGGTSPTLSGVTLSDVTGATQCLHVSSLGLITGTGSDCGSGGGAVSSVSNSDSTLTISPTTGAVVASLNLAHANTWSAAQALGSSTATTQSADDNSTKLATTAYVDRTVVRAIGWSFGDVATGSALTTSEVGYITVPFACTVTGWHIMVDAGTATVKTWRVNAGTALPTTSNSISTSGVAISTGTKIDSTTVTDFTSTAIAANDTLGFAITAVATAKQLTFQLDCKQ